MTSLAEVKARSRCRPFSGENGTIATSLRGRHGTLANFGVMESSAYDLAWTRVGRRDAMKAG